MFQLDVRNAYKNIYTGHLKMKGQNPDGDVIDFTNYYMTYNKNPLFVISGEFHFSRYDCNMWEKEILKIKACGINVIATYMFWIHHESECGSFDFAANNNIREFILLCGKHDMKVVLRVGPYAHGECRNGGLPEWLFGRPFQVRTNDEEYLKFVGRYFNAIGEEVKDLMFTKGGNVIGVQLENEYMAACSPWEVTVTQNREWITSGRDGLSHMEKLKAMAEAAGIKTAFFTCTGWGNAPIIEDEMLPLWGGYAYWPWLFWDPSATEHPPTYSYLFRDNHDESRTDDFNKKYPFACCEMGGGMQTWYQYRFVVEPESVEAMSLVTLASGCNFIGYFMFHGGRNPVIGNMYMNEQWNPRISYDFQAPLGDFGQPKESYKRIKLLHYFLQDFNDEMCASKAVVPTGQDKIEPTDTTSLRYAARSDGRSGFLFINNYQDHVEQTEKTDIQIAVETDNGVITIPSNNKLTIKKNTACVMIFGTELSGLKLKFSTAQYITRIEDTYFFFCHEGTAGEFCFDEVYDIIDCRNAAAETIDGKIYVYTGKEGITFFTVNSVDGEKIKFCCLDRKQSLDFWKVKVKGKDYAIISKSNVYYTNDSISLECPGIAEQEILTYPKLDSFNTLNGTVDFQGNDSFKTLNGTVDFQDNDSFKSLNSTVELHDYDDYLYSYIAKTDLPEINVILKITYNNRAIVKFDPKVLNELSEAYLKVDYTGDIGWAFIDGKLIHDDISNGTTWNIGLKSFADRLTDNELYLYISPKLEDNKAVKHESNSTYAKVTISENKTAEFQSVTICPEKTIILSF